MPEVDSQLAANLKLAKTTPMRFAFVTKSPNDGRLILAKKPPVPPKEIAEAKKELGGGHVYLGRLRWENDQYVFEVASEPPPTLANTIRTMIHHHTGMAVKVIIRVAADLAAEEAGTPADAGTQAAPVIEVPPPAPPPAATQAAPAAQADAARFMARLKALLPQIQRAEAGGSPVGQEIKLRAGEAQTFAQKKTFDQANSVLDQIEVLLKQAPAATSPPPAAPPHPAADPAAQALWLKRRHALEPALLAALKDQRGDVSKMRTVFAFAQEKAQASNYGPAMQALDQLEQLLAAAATAPSPIAPAATDNGFSTQWPAAQSELKIAIDKVGDQLEEFAVALLDTGEENLVWVAEEGLSQLMTGLRDAGSTIDRAVSKDPTKAAAKARPAIEDLRKQLQSPRVQACDENKLDVEVTIRDTIGKAIKRLEDALALAKAG